MFYTVSATDLSAQTFLEVPGFCEPVLLAGWTGKQMGLRGRFKGSGKFCLSRRAQERVGSEQS
jgi:hypothetical protein